MTWGNLILDITANQFKLQAENMATFVHLSGKIVSIFYKGKHRRTLKDKFVAFFKSKD